MDVGIGKADSQFIPYAVKTEIARLVNEEKLLVSTVAKRFNVTHASATRIATAALKSEGSKQQFAPAASDGEGNAIMPPCPFTEGDTPSLRGKKLTAEEKHYLACLVIIQHIPCTHVAAHYDLPASTMDTFVQRARKGLSFATQKSGTPPVIDLESDLVLQGLAGIEGTSRPSRAEMIVHITRELAKTLERRGLTPPPSQESSLSAQSGDDTGSVTVPDVNEPIFNPNEGTSDIAKKSPRTLMRYLKHYGF